MTFEELWDNQLLPELQVLENERKKLFRQYILPMTLTGIGTVITGAIGYFRLENGVPFAQNIMLILAIILGITLVTLFIKSSKPLSLYKEKFKNNIVSVIVKSLNENLNYSPYGGITQQEFKRSRLFLTKPDRYKSEDFVEGVIDKTKIKFSEVHAEYKTEHRDSKGNKRTEWHDIFKGIFFIADFNKPFKTKTIVLPDTAEKMFGSYLGSLFQKANISRKEELVKLENPVFEKEFVVYGDDQIESRYILTPDLMEKILELKTSFRKELHISFISNNVHIAIPYKDLFEPSYYKSIIDKSTILEYYQVLSRLINIVELLNLNTRIWGKG
ncbi:MAG: DUF3137 domain-containing protein [Calditrichia bacterium]